MTLPVLAASACLAAIQPTAVLADAPVPRLVLDGEECPMLTKAFELMREAIVTEPVFGFTEPFFPPGAAYGKNWWQLDGATGKLRARPRIKSDFRLENLALPGGSRATVSCTAGEICIEVGGRPTD